MWQVRGAASLPFEGCPQIGDPPRRQRKSDETVPGLTHSDLAPETQGTVLAVRLPSRLFLPLLFFP